MSNAEQKDVQGLKEQTEENVQEQEPHTQELSTKEIPAAAKESGDGNDKKKDDEKDEKSDDAKDKTDA